MAWLNLTMPNQTVKNGLKAKKIKLIFSRKTSNKIFTYLLARFIRQYLKKILRADPELWGCAIFGTKMAHLSWIIFFWYKPLLLLSSTFWPFSLCKIQKNSYSGSTVMRMGHYWAQNGQFACPKQRIFWKIIKIILIYLLASFIVQNSKKILPADPELRGYAIFGPKMAQFPKWGFFFRKPINEPCSFHSCLSACQKPKSDINLLL